MDTDSSGHRNALKLILSGTLLVRCGESYDIISKVNANNGSKKSTIIGELIKCGSDIDIYNLNKELIGTIKTFGEDYDIFSTHDLTDSNFVLYEVRNGKIGNLLAEFEKVGEEIYIYPFDEQGNKSKNEVAKIENCGGDFYINNYDRNYDRKQKLQQIKEPEEPSIGF